VTGFYAALAVELLAAAFLLVAGTFVAQLHEPWGKA